MYDGEAGNNDYPAEFAFADSLNGWLVGYGRLALHTEDGGRTWNAQTLPYLAAARAVYFWSADTGIVGGIGGAILTYDGGETWQKTEGLGFHEGTLFEGLAMSFADRKRGVLVGRGARYTSDGGLTWQTHPEWIYIPTTVDLLPSGVGYAWSEISRYHSAGYRTDDFGQTWTRITQDTTKKYSHPKEIVALSDSALLVSFESVSELFTADAGATFKRNDWHGSKRRLFQKVREADGSLTLYGYSFSGLVYRARNAQNYTITARPETEPVAAGPLRVYPNPARESFTVAWRNLPNGGALVMRNLLGQELSRRSISTVSGELHLDVSDRPEGVYIIAMEGDHAVQHIKLIVAH